jgi:putative flavoprotein involved in K+ transport
VKLVTSPEAGTSGFTLDSILHPQPRCEKEKAMLTQKTAPNPKNTATRTYVEEGAAFKELAVRATGGTEKDAIAESGKNDPTERFTVIVIGAGQSGLSVGYHLARRGISFVIIDANERIGDSWRSRWDSLHLFSPARYDGLDGMRFPGPVHAFPTKDEMADFLATYAAQFGLPVRNGVKVDTLLRQGDRYIVTAGNRRFESAHVVVATGGFRHPRVPPFAHELDPGIVQFHSSAYRNPAQLKKGGVLIVGAGNSGSEIAKELASHGHQVWMSGRDTGHIPFRIAGFFGRHLLVRLVVGFVFYHVLTTSTPIGRKARPKVISQGGPLIRVKPKDLLALGVEFAPRTAAIKDGMPVLANGRVLDVMNVVWCTGYEPGFSWIQLPAFGGNSEPAHTRGVVKGEPGLYFVGLEFLYSMASGMVQGVGRDARHVVDQIASRMKG